MIGQEGPDLLGDGRVGFVGQANVLEPRCGLTLGSIARTALGKETVDDQALRFLPGSTC